MLQLVGGAVDLAHVLAGQGVLQLPQLRLHFLPLVGGNLFTDLAQHPLGLVDERIPPVPCVGHFAPVLVLLSVALRLLHHLLDLIFGERRRAGDLNGLLPARGGVFRLDVEDAVGVDVERHFDLWHAARRGWNAVENETPQRAVVARHLPFALQDVDLHLGLAVGRGGEDLALPRGDRGIAGNERRHDAAQRLHAQRQGRDVEQHHLPDGARQHTGLDRRAHRHHLVGMHFFVRLFTGQAADEFLDHRHACGAADENDFIQILLGHLGVSQRLLERTDAALHQIRRHLLKLRPGQHVVEVFGAGGIGGDEGEVDRGLRHGGQLHLGTLRRLAQPLQRLPVLPQIDAMLALELVSQPVHDTLVPVIAAQVGIAVGGLHLKDALADLKDGDIEGAAAKVEDQNRLRLFLVQPVRQAGRRGLVDNTQHLQPGDLTGVLGGRALGVVEVCRHSNDGLAHRLPQIGLGVRLHFLQDHRRELFRGERFPGRRQAHHGHPVAALLHLVGDHLALGLDFGVPPPHESFDGVNGILRVEDGLPFGHLPHEAFPSLGEGHHGGRQAAALRVGDHLRLTTDDDGDDRVGRTQIDADDLTHFRVTPLCPDSCSTCCPCA